MMKKIALLVLVMFVILVPVYNSRSLVIAENNDYTIEEIEQEIADGVDKQLDKVDFSALDELVSKLTADQTSIFASSSFSEKIKKLINGDFDDNYNSVFAAIMSIVLDEILSFIPLVALIIAVAVLSSIINSIKPLGNKSLSDLIHFVCYGVIVVLLMKASTDFLNLALDVITSIKMQMEIILPILLTFLTAMGGIVSARVYQPVVAILAGVIIHIFNSVLIPIFICLFIFTILSNLTNVVKFDKFTAFFQSIFKWIIGIVFTVFMGFLSLQGIIAATRDGISIKTAKYAIKSHIPLVGGYLSDGFDLILTGSMLIKNAVGVGGILLLVATVVVPVIKIAVFGLLLKLVAAITEPICDSRITNLISNISKILPLLIVCILCVAFMFVLTLILIMFTANNFV